MKKACAVCQSAFESEDPDVLFFTEAGSARYICPHCKELYETATLSREPDAIDTALSDIYKHTDRLTDVSTLEFLAASLGDAKERLSSIREGSYDFSLDDDGEEIVEEIPEEYRPDEAEEKAAEEKRKKLTPFDYAIDILWIAAGVAAVGYLIYMIINLFFL